MKRSSQWSIVWGFSLAGMVLSGGVCRAADLAPSPASDQLIALRHKIELLQQDLAQGAGVRSNSKLQVLRLKRLLALQRQEKALTEKRLAILESTVHDLESRRNQLRAKVEVQQKTIQKFLKALEVSQREIVLEKKSSDAEGIVREKLEMPRRRVLGQLVERSLKEIEKFQADLADANRLEAQIQTEKQELVYWLQDLKEQQSVFELNQQLQSDYLKKPQSRLSSRGGLVALEGGEGVRLGQFRNYRNLKSAEAQVEHLIQEFNARRELEKAEEAERIAVQAASGGVFEKQKGRLPFPVYHGQVLSQFGRTYEPSSGLYVFKKGIDIAVGAPTSVKAVSSGRIAFAGQLPHYGNVVIIDHGEHFYSLSAHLGVVSKKLNEPVVAGDAIGVTDNSGTPLYFEIRARNVAVNPLQWLFN